MSYGYNTHRKLWPAQALDNLNKYINKELPVRTLSGRRRKRTDWEKEQLRYFDVIVFNEDMFDA